nr:MAG TPA: hypothetical protein [Inoviridae sp.]
MHFQQKRKRTAVFTAVLSCINSLNRLMSRFIKRLFSLVYIKGDFCQFPH